MKLQLMTGQTIDITAEQWQKLQRFLEQDRRPTIITINGHAVRHTDIIGVVEPDNTLESRFQQLGLDLSWLERARKQ